MPRPSPTVPAPQARSHSRNRRPAARPAAASASKCDRHRRSSQPFAAARSRSCVAACRMQPLRPDHVPPSPRGKIDRPGLPGSESRAKIAVDLARLGDLSRNLLGSRRLRILRRREVLDDPHIPHAVQVRRIALALQIRFHRHAVEKCHGDAVAAQVVVRRVVQRLMNVAHKMNHESQRIRTRLSRRGRIAEHAHLRGQRRNHAARRRWTISRDIALGRPRGMSMKCHGPVSGFTLRSSSAHVDESTNGSSPVCLQYRERSASIGLFSRICRDIFAARGLRCFSAINATI